MCFMVYSGNHSGRIPATGKSGSKYMTISLTCKIIGAKSLKSFLRNNRNEPEPYRPEQNKEA